MLPFHVFPSQPKSPEHLTLCSEQEKGVGRVPITGKERLASQGF